jgi:RNA polymerase sigma factor (TIGR02999 family)
MRRVLVDHARKKQAAKRGGAGDIRLEMPFTAMAPDSEVLAVDQALRRLERIDARKAQVVERKYFGGMTTEVTAVSLAISAATVERDWTMAKAWLFRELKGPTTPL